MRLMSARARRVRSLAGLLIIGLLILCGNGDAAVPGAESDGTMIPPVGNATAIEADEHRSLDASSENSNPPNSPVSGSASGAEYAGYNLFSALNSTTAHLIDNDGNTVHSWATDYRPGNSMYLLEDGALALQTPGPNDFERGGQVVFPTTNGRVVVDYSAGPPTVRFEPATR